MLWLTCACHDRPSSTVQACEPSLPGMPALLEELNAGGSFSRFVRCVRQQFQAAVAAEAQPAAAAAQAQPMVAAC
jgi:hypothetical protein